MNHYPKYLKGSHQGVLLLTLLAKRHCKEPTQVTCVSSVPVNSFRRPQANFFLLYLTKH